MIYFSFFSCQSHVYFVLCVKAAASVQMPCIYTPKNGLRYHQMQYQNTKGLLIYREKISLVFVSTLHFLAPLKVYAKRTNKEESIHTWLH